MLVVCIAATSGPGGLAFGSPSTACIIIISDIIHSFDHQKSSSVSQLINGKSRDLQILIKYFNGKTTSASNILLSSGVFPTNFVLYSNDLLVVVLLLFILLLTFSFAPSSTSSL